MAAVDFIPLESSLYNMINEGMYNELLEMNGSFYMDPPSPTSEKRYTLLEGDQHSYDHSSVTMAAEQCQSTAATFVPNSTSVSRLLPNDVSLDSWKKTHPEQWTSNDVLNLIYSIAMKNNDIKFSNLKGERFQNVTGAELCRMNEDDFTRRDPIYGKLLFSCVQNLLQCSDFFPPIEMINLKQRPFDVSNQIQTEIPITVEEVTFDEHFDDIEQNLVNMFGINYDINTFQNSDFKTRDTNLTLSSGLEEGAIKAATWMFENHFTLPDSTSYHRPQHRLHQMQQHQQFSQNPPLDVHFIPDSTYTTITHADRGPCKPNSSSIGIMGSSDSCNRKTDSMKRSKDRSLSSDGESSSSGSSYGGGVNAADGVVSTTNPTCASSIGSFQDEVFNTRYMNGGKGNHLWEFLCQQLKLSECVQTKDRIIQWESRDDGVFRIVDSKEIAIKWGDFKGNRNMTYEKLSRALRWCRTNGFLATLPKDGKFPKKLCFRFGPRAATWRDFV